MGNIVVKEVTVVKQRKLRSARTQFLPLVKQLIKKKKKTQVQRAAEIVLQVNWFLTNVNNYSTLENLI